MRRNTELRAIRKKEKEETKTGKTFRLLLEYNESRTNGTNG